ATPGARREYNDARVAERDALRKLGYDSFDAFADAHRASAREAAPTTAGARQTVDRIRVLLGELGVEPGDDPLNSAKKFLSRVEGDDLTPAMHRAKPSTHDVAPPPSPIENALPFPERAGVVDDAPHFEEKPPVGVVDDSEPQAPAAADTTGADHDLTGERADARAERWHAELEQVRAELTAITEARNAAEREAAQAREQLDAARADLARAQEVAHHSAAEVDQRLAERDDALVRREQLEVAFARANDEIEALR